MPDSTVPIIPGPGADTVLVTGGAGFVGSAIVRAALAEGFAVRVLVRKTSPRQNLVGLPIETIEGDMREEATLARALAGARFLFHAAADYRLCAPDPSEIERNNL